MRQKIIQIKQNLPTAWHLAPTKYLLQKCIVHCVLVEIHLISGKISIAAKLLHICMLIYFYFIYLHLRGVDRQNLQETPT